MIKLNMGTKEPCFVAVPKLSQSHEAKRHKATSVLSLPQFLHPRPILSLKVYHIYGTNWCDTESGTWMIIQSNPRIPSLGLCSRTWKNRIQPRKPLSCIPLYNDHYVSHTTRLPIIPRRTWFQMQKPIKSSKPSWCSVPTISRTLRPNHSRSGTKEPNRELHLCYQQPPCSSNLNYFIPWWLSESKFRIHHQKLWWELIVKSFGSRRRKPIL